MAYTVDVQPPRCSCGLPAKKQVFNNRNAPVGEFCAGCAARKLRELEAAEGADRPLPEHEG